MHRRTWYAAAGVILLALAGAYALPAAEGRGREGPREGALKAGDVAPDFTLKSPDGKTTVTLSSFKGKKPVVLVFASYT